MPARLEALAVDVTTLAVDAIVNAANGTLPGGGAGEPAMPASCYRQSIELAERLAIASIAFPAIRCGACACPREAAVAIAASEVRAEVARVASVERAVFACRGVGAPAAFAGAPD